MAGGLSRRMGTDKAFVPIAGRPMLAHVIERLAPQCTALVINAAGDPARFGAFGQPVVADTIPGFPGPLAGVLAGLAWCARTHPDVAWMVSSAVDTPFLPADLVARLHRARREADADIGCAASLGRRQPVAALWPVTIADELAEAVTGQGIRAVAAFTDRYRLAIAEWPADPVDPFFNVNEPADRDEAERLIGAGG